MKKNVRTLWRRKHTWNRGLRVSYDKMRDHLEALLLVAEGVTRKLVSRGTEGDGGRQRGCRRGGAVLVDLLREGESQPLPDTELHVVLVFVLFPFIVCLHCFELQFLN